jgi:5-methyltetrahydropteroyltriglutamate--homocysteine methyltransferase
MEGQMAKKYRAEQVGSLLRPQEVLDAHAARAKGEMTDEQVRRFEDAAILEAIELQRQAGIEVLSDGELRRSSWAGDFNSSVEGYVAGSPALRMVWSGTVGQAPGPPQGGGHVIGGRLRPRRRLTENQAGFLKQHASGVPFKVTMPAASYVTARGYKPGVSEPAYANRAAVLDDVTRIISDEVKALASEGVPYIQLDNPHYADYIDAGRMQQMQAYGWDTDAMLTDDIEADNACLRGFDRSNVTLAMHFCRGNGGRGGWHTSGGYDAIAEQVFGQLDVDTFLLEYDSERSGSFEPLRYMPKGKTVVLGLITTKSGELEPAEEVVKRIEEAAKYVDLDDLALSPQCGFASVAIGNPVTPDEQRRKLDLVSDVARKVWG